MSLFHPYMGKPVAIEVTEYRGKGMNGLLIDIGEDYLVLHRESSYYYIALQHLHLLRADLDAQMLTPSAPQWTASGSTFASLIIAAKGQFIELYLTGQQTLYGRILHIMDDYIVFDTVRHHISYIPAFHIKWFSPASSDGFLNTSPDSPATSLPFRQTWIEQLEVELGSVIVIDLGLRTDQVGRLHAIHQGIIELVTPDGLSKCWHAAHIKSVHLPKR
ncbi:YuzF family protein [Paenibacillus oenotherae]|uniref:YuzF family protein n=1 Tax=Paenibacillus oenotherae TaxID=1435645 RepID=A0ABS7D8H2_9BACL|nr:YuzF family protein [Paenibacillus oenotherae]MBW7476223.1 YuzF family protein [Paenibacillus oenotherae]